MRRWFWGAGAGIFAALLLLRWINSPPPGATEGVVTIAPGTSAARVARTLAEQGAIRSSAWFRLLARASFSAGRLRVGVYRTRPDRSAWRLLRDIVTGRTATLRVTLPEGFATWQAADRFGTEAVCPVEDFRRASAGTEGYLFPDTYYFDAGTPAERVVKALTGRFEEVWGEVVREAQAAGAVAEVLVSSGSPDVRLLRLADGRRWTMAQAVTMASLIERETRRAEERSLVSAVYHNRLKKRMRLEADPTVQYALGHWKARLLYRDLDVDSPYNTYRRYGLPPGPICSPGRAALAAALAPANVEFLYFVADPETGAHQFSLSYREHLRNVRGRNQRRRALRVSSGG